MNNFPCQCSIPPQIFLPRVGHWGLIFYCMIYVNVFLILRLNLLFWCITELLFIIVLGSHIKSSEKKDHSQQQRHLFWSFLIK